MVKLLWVFLCWWQVTSLVYCEIDQNCTKSECECCVDNDCDQGTYFLNECNKGCIDGHRGRRCYELCENNCKSCPQNENTCTSCYNGFFLRSGACMKCPTNCKSCSSSSYCETCKEGFINQGDAFTCEHSRCPTNCICDKSDCVSCKNVFYDTSNSCKHKCPLNCVTCNSLNDCKECQNGYYNGHELDNDDNPLLNNCTHTCRDTCTRCSSYNICQQCPAGKYGLQCQEYCSAGCRDNICLIKTGNCNCLSNFAGDKCAECKPGRFGINCNQDCPVNCKNDVCDRLSGNCTEGCFLDSIIGGKCDTCVVGRHGALCEKTCSENCKDMKCTKDTGACSNGCKPSFNGTFCDKCTKNKYGDNCQHVCPKACADNTCQKQSGYCFQCIGNFVGETCSVCKPGFYGTACTQSCSINCFNITCDITEGVCDYGCKKNYSGDKCCLNNNNCIQCSSNTDCQECKSGYFQTLCKEICPKNCLGSCAFSTGVCNVCVINRFGPFCNMTCSDNCNASRNNVSSCASPDGTCVFGCKDGFFGRTCNETCSSFCIDDLCTKEKGVCIKGCRESQDDPACALNSGQTPTSTDPPNVIGPIIGGVSAAVIVIISVIVFVVCFLKRRRKENPSDHQRNIDAMRERAQEGHVYENFRETQLLEDDVERNSTLNDARTAADVDEVEIEERFENAADKPIETYYNIGPNSHRVKVNDLFLYVTTRPVESFTSEFANLAKDLDLTKHCTFARDPENLPLNRYNGIYPYDHSRVTISGEPGFFINACYIDGYNNRRKAYIASLGPTAKTTDKFSTFWRMIWNEKSDIIVMLTNLREASGMKCEKYWPDSETENVEAYGPIKVTCRSVETFAEYTVRTFSISKGKEQRHILQLHYTAWPDKGVPQEVTSLVEFRQKVKAVPVTLGGPVTVHCSAGVGRSGTYIALDQLTEEGQREGSVDVFNCVNRMRQQRVNMVQTAEQYKFLYKALVHSLSFGCEALTAEEIQGLTYEAAGKMFTDMFETLQQEVDIESQEDSDDRQENKRRHKDKNRRHSDIPANRSRVRLYLARADGHHDYINAVFINSFKIKNLFIAAQSPLPETVEDFLCMIYQQSSSCVVALEETHKHNNDVGKYLPADNESYKCGDFIVKSSKCETKEQYIMKKLSIQNTKKSEAKTVYHFQYKAWGNSKKTPESVEDFVHFIKDVEKCLRLQTEDNQHIVVHCLNGYERSGLFCVVYTMLEKLEAERQVSVVNTVRKIRTHRKQSITCVEQLKYCFQCISAYLEMYNTYSNFAT